MDDRTRILPKQKSRIYLADEKTGAKISLQPGSQVFGREAGFADSGVSRRHFELTLTDGVVSIEDLRSANGTELNGSSLVPGQPRQLKVGDVIEFGASRLRLCDETAAAGTRPIALTPSPKPGAPIAYTSPATMAPKPEATSRFSSWDWASCVVAGLASLLVLTNLLMTLVAGNAPNSMLKMMFFTVVYSMLGMAAALKLQLWLSRKFPHNGVMAATIPLTLFTYMLTVALLAALPGSSLTIARAQNKIFAACETKSVPECASAVREDKRAYGRMEPEWKEKVVERVEAYRKQRATASQAPAVSPPPAEAPQP